MRKEEFLTALRAGLTGLLPEGVEKLVEFCSEMIDDRMETAHGRRSRCRRRLH